MKALLNKQGFFIKYVYLQKNNKNNMIILEHGLPEIMAVLNPQKIEDIEYRWNKCIISQEVADGILLFNDMTKSFVLLSKKEYKIPSDKIVNFLINTYFLVPMDFNEIEVGNILKKHKFKLKKFDNQHSSQFTILPTTACNARCFYCYEKGCKTKVMTEETAKKSAEFIASHRDASRPVILRWFGGEPTCNIKAMDTICKCLADKKIEYYSNITSNGYLLNEENFKRIVDLWHIKEAQITLDGTEEVYNKSKNFIYKDTNAFEIVLNNIEMLISNGIQLEIRLNIGEHNYEDIHTLIDQIYDRFRNNRNLIIYVMPLFGEKDRKKREIQYENADKINHHLYDLGYWSNSINRKYDDSCCSADCGKALQILPDGNIGLCEHFTDDDFVGHITSKTLNFKRIGEWSERIDMQEGCSECPLYSHCIRIKHCPERNVCYFEERDYLVEREKLNMLKYYEMAKSSQYYQEQLMNQGGIQS